MPSKPDFVFINCPFDNDYKPIFRAVIFTIYYCGFQPRCAMEEDDAADNRIDKIIRLIRECPYGIHDISRTTLDDTTNLPRFNMPFELGIFWGARQFGDKAQKRKKVMVMEAEKYAYQKYLSDINGVDIKAHHNNYKTVIELVRNWLRTVSKRKNMPGPAVITRHFEVFAHETLPVLLHSNGINDDRLQYNDYCLFTEECLSKLAAS